MRGVVTFFVVVFLSACTACSATKQQLAKQQLAEPQLVPSGAEATALPVTARESDKTRAQPVEAKSHTEVHVSVLKIVITAPQPGNLVIGSQAGSLAR